MTKLLKAFSKQDMKKTHKKRTILDAQLLPIALQQDAHFFRLDIYLQIFCIIFTRLETTRKNDIFPQKKEKKQISRKITQRPIKFKLIEI